MARQFIRLFGQNRPEGHPDLRPGRPLASPLPVQKGEGGGGEPLGRLGPGPGDPAGQGFKGQVDGVHQPGHVASSMSISWCLGNTRTPATR